MTEPQKLALANIRDTLLDEDSSPLLLCAALDDFTLLCSEIGGVRPDPGFDAWAEDAFLDTGTAINPAAAAHCVRDYQRTVVFIRALYAAICACRQRFPGSVIRILYAGCGPFATLIMPLLGIFEPGVLEVHLLDFHRQSLDSVRRLLAHFGLAGGGVTMVQADACSYQHPVALHLIVAETMQKSLEQEPQFAVTANLAPQLSARGIFIPEKVTVELCLGHLEREREIVQRQRRIDPDKLASAGLRHTLATVFTLVPGQAAALRERARRNEETAQLELGPVRVEIPAVDGLESLDPLLCTRIQVFDNYRLGDHEAEITLPLRCPELLPLRGGDCYQVSYQLGAYPRFNLVPVPRA